MLSRGFLGFFILLLLLLLLFTVNFLENGPIINEQEQPQFLNEHKEISYLDSYRALDKENFITYLPHSGFHNQRISTENAIFLAWYLNRTLILPPLIFFSGIPPFGMSPFDQLSPRLSQLRPDRNNFTECEEHKCITANYTFYHWEELMNVKWIKQNVRIIYRRDFIHENLLNVLNIEEQRIFYTKGNSRYHHRYYDYLNSTVSLDEFKERIDLEKLKDRKEKLLYFDSLFSVRRVVREFSESKKFWHRLTREFVPENPIIIKIVNNIVRKIGGERNFLGVHARFSDKKFRGVTGQTIESTILKISNDYREYENVFKFSKKNTEVSKQIGKTILTSTKLEEKNEIPFFEKCSSKFTNDTLPVIIFLATDGKRSHSSLKSFLDKFPCVFMLEDFEEDCELLKTLVNPIDNVNMFKHLIPLVDLMIASRGVRFYGTPYSTFSLYAQTLNRLFNNYF